MSLLTDGMKFLEAMKVMLMIEYFYRHKLFAFMIYALKSDVIFVLIWQNVR